MARDIGSNLPNICFYGDALYSFTASSYVLWSEFLYQKYLLNLTEKMNIAAIVLFILSVVFGLLMVCVAYLIVTYLNKKALGMQTLMDPIIKDTIYLATVSEIIGSVMMLIVQFTRPLSHSLAILFTIAAQFLKLIGICQLNMIFWMRYLYVFHYANLNIVDEKLMKRITRSCVAILSTILMLMSIGNVEDSHAYQHFTDGDSISVLNPVVALTAIISLVSVIIIQFKIEMFKKSVDTRQFDQLETGEDQFVNCQYLKLETYRIEVLILVSGILLMLSFWFVNSTEDLDIKFFQAILLEKFLFLSISLICIKRSEKMFSSCKNQIFAWFCQHPHTNEVIIADLNLDSNNQETYVTDILDQNSNNDDQGEVTGNDENEFSL